MERKLLKKTPLFDKINFVRQIVKEAMNIEDDAVITLMLSRVRRRNNGEGGNIVALNLSNNEIVFEQLLKTYKIRPSTAYGWFLFLRSKNYVLEKLQNSEITTNKALKLNKADRELPKTLGRQILDEINLLVKEM